MSCIQNKSGKDMINRFIFLPGLFYFYLQDALKRPYSDFNSQFEEFLMELI